MRPMNSVSRILLAAGVVTGFFFATTASALVTVNATSATTSAMVGDTFTVDIEVDHDGGGTLIAVFSSHTWDNSQLTLLSAVFASFPAAGESAPAIFSGQFEAGLGRFGTITGGIAGDDLSSSARTVQYAALAASSISGIAEITQLTFMVIGVGDGVAEVTGTFLAGESGADGDSFTFGSNVAVTVPEPSAVVLSLSALGSVFAVVGLRRRN